MKRVFALLAGVWILFGSAFAADVDLISMTIDELIALRNDIHVEINSRLTDLPMTIYTGSYVGGKTIKPGMYLVSGMEKDSFGAIYLYSDETATDCVLGFPQSVGFETQIFVIIEEGMVFDVTGVLGLRETTKPEWMP